MNIEHYLSRLLLFFKVSIRIISCLLVFFLEVHFNPLQLLAQIKAVENAPIETEDTDYIGIDVDDVEGKKKVFSAKQAYHVALKYQVS